ncbi:MAG: peptidase MA family metallohydrolase [Planctomycetota bacterium]|nr:peptidase MA family metallohydrolase [Planctomycetota bacterium]
MRWLPGSLGMLAVLVLGAGLGWVALRLFEPEPTEPRTLPMVVPDDLVASPSRRLVDSGADEPAEERADLRWVRRNNEAMAELDAGHVARAIELFRECHEAEPENDIFRRNLAESLSRLAWQNYDEGGLKDALATLEEAHTLAPERDDLTRQIARWRTELELAANHVTAPGIYFELSYDAEREDLVLHAQTVLDFLEGGGGHVAAYEDMRNWFGIDPYLESGRKLRVVLYDRADFDTLTGLGDWAGGVFDGVLRITVEDLETERSRWQRILRHELVHAFVREVGGRDVPGWLNEGLAQLLEGDVKVEQARRSLSGAEFFPLERLRASLATWQRKEDIALAYAQSLALVEHLERTYGSDELGRMLRGCKEGRTPAELFEERNGFGLDTVLEDLRREL